MVPHGDGEEGMDSGDGTQDHFDGAAGAWGPPQYNLACEICGKEFSSRTSLADHRPVHEGEVGYYERGSYLDTFPPSAIPQHFPCDQCEKVFTTPGSLRNHT